MKILVEVGQKVNHNEQPGCCWGQKRRGGNSACGKHSLSGNGQTASASLVAWLPGCAVLASWSCNQGSKRLWAMAKYVLGVQVQCQGPPNLSVFCL